ncbi:DinB family protein [Nocardioides acrostichi]|uniref:DinB family protein n=1 Tax=Nocardioides acrostichi TaxID=2784339 RepID=A0A930V124_9ACTN|nr:DinB family protein [Nocardioides acrostichi]MBF4162089.1 DinB family protein [Nocardioides acrostichi]
MTTIENASPDNDDPQADERADLLDLLAQHRGLLLQTVQGLNDEQAAATPTASALCLGGILKHLAAGERQWSGFVVDGAWSDDVDWAEVDWSNPPSPVLAYLAQFQMADGENLAAIVADYERAAAATDALVRTADLGSRQALPSAPWFEPGTSWSARRVFGHLVAEIAQHAGHADIIRESIDGQKTMG